WGVRHMLTLSLARMALLLRAVLVRCAPCNGRGPVPQRAGMGQPCEERGKPAEEHRATEVTATRARSPPARTPPVAEGRLRAVVAVTSVARCEGQPLSQNSAPHPHRSIAGAIEHEAQKR